MSPRIPIDQAAIAAFCRKWQVTELALFGSVLRDDFGPNSDVDVLVTFELNADIGLLEMIRMERELERLLGRSVDVVEKAGLKPLMQRDVVSSAEILYAA